MFNQEDFLSELKEKRKLMGISRAEMARRMETSPSQIYYIEKGNTTLRSLVKYLEVLKLDLNDIFVD